MTSRLQSIENETLAEEELLLAEGHLTRRLFAAMLRRMAALPAPTG